MKINIGYFITLITLMFFHCKQLYAHELDLELKVLSSSVIEGQISTSHDDGSFSQYISIENLSDSSFSKLTLQSNQYGQFKLIGVPGHRYRIMLEGEENHIVSEEVVLPKSLPSDNI
ncbi:hypothetical protein Q4489_06740 [Thalassotalea sp. 1_MG-2023]|uniref:hypothetical protein n=1 Tax=Thalassotalea sp. 1_MG-2023 TaxID=3062680 RepID=UPI0026E330CA|nr:hypothetical protein [Thalassotalea sp. 1_MG-2023]MDO6426703.1 hypothetical protein [Thalassotalea sp. 1_MG-2023]